MSPPGAPNTKIFKGWACLLRAICFSPLWKKTRFSLHPEVLKPSVGRLPRPPGRVNYPSDARSTQHWPQRVVGVCLRPRLSHGPSNAKSYTTSVSSLPSYHIPTTSFSDPRLLSVPVTLQIVLLLGHILPPPYWPSPPASSSQAAFPPPLKDELSLHVPTPASLLPPSPSSQSSGPVATRTG